ncbi:hypothetical protein BC938DRAFT_475821 [Jimgerdemannia flammicorona]|uniref:Uncharacterized protein n=1 Tax=Jimgerdemannia flammicorona TaxID=994334 RepID=A0A433PNN4_9FUNG|nr:hypothetical protein BC938DRAFT_475821 [Jimgerdemannia flammicorona]
MPNPSLAGATSSTPEKLEEDAREVVVTSPKAGPKNGVRSLVMAFEEGASSKKGTAPGAEERKPIVSAATRRVELRTPTSVSELVSTLKKVEDGGHKLTGGETVTSPTDFGPSSTLSSDVVSKRSTKIFVKPGIPGGFPSQGAYSPPPTSPSFSDDGDDQSSRRYRPSYASAATTSSYYSSAYETASMHSLADSLDSLDTAPTSPVLDGDFHDVLNPRAFRARERESSDAPEIYVVGADPSQGDDDGVTSESDDDDEDDDDVFVDATGASQDDIERERVVEKLTKRLSGGHYGSAGGLILSTASEVIMNRNGTAGLEDLRALAERAMTFVDRGPGEGGARGSGASIITVRGVVGSGMRESSASIKTVRGAAVHGSEGGKLGVEDEEGGFSDSTVIADEERERERVKERERIKGRERERERKEKEREAKAEKRKTVDEDIEEQARDAARKCWMEEPAFVEKEKMAEFLGTG